MNIEKFYPNVRGGKWHGKTIKYEHMLENPLYKDTSYYKNNNIKNEDLALF